MDDPPSLPRSLGVFDVDMDNLPWREPSYLLPFLHPLHESVETVVP
jgi:hypothetical protein